jgi:hypothetical protein
MLIGILCSHRLPITEEASPSELLEWLERSVLKKNKSPFRYVEGKIGHRRRGWDRAKLRRASLYESFISTDPLLPLSGIEALRALSQFQQNTLSAYLQVSRDIESDPRRAEESAISILAALWGMKPKAAQKKLDRAREALAEAIKTFL